MVVDELPTQSGSTVTFETFETCRDFLLGGHDVTLVVVCDAAVNLELDDSMELVRQGAKFEFLKLSQVHRRGGVASRTIELFSSKPETLWPLLQEADSIIEKVKQTKPDIVYCFADYPVMFALKSLRDSRMLLIAGDPPHDSLRHWALARRSRMNRLERLFDFRGINQLWTAKKMKRVEETLGKSLPPVGFHDLKEVLWAQRSEWNSPYFSPPVIPDLGSDTWAETVARLAQRSSDAPLRLVYFGVLSGQATRQGLLFLADNLMPEIVRSSRLHVSVDVIGKDAASIGDDLLAKLECAGVRVRGFVPDLAASLSKEYDAALLPIPSRKGSRPRILYCWSLGLPVIALSTVLGRLENFQPGRNILIGDSSQDLLDLLVRVSDDPRLLAEIGSYARRSFEETYKQNHVTAKMIEILSQ